MVDKVCKKVALEYLVSGGWAGDETVFKNEGMEYITITQNEISFASEDDVDEFAEIAKELVRGLS